MIVNKIYSVLFYVAIFWGIGFNCFGQLQVNNNMPYNTAAGAGDVLLGNGVATSNLTFYGNPIQMALFSDGLSSIGLDSGIVLSTGDIGDLPLPGFGGGGITTPGAVPGTEAYWGPSDMGVLGNNDLINVANSVPPLVGQAFSVSSANDAAVLEFDFVPSGDTVQFRYVFGSNEYLVWINSSFNDVFGFFVSGPGIAGPYSSPAGFPNGSINIANVPGTNPPVPVTTSSVQPAINSQYYIDNVTNIDVAMSGYTTTLTATMAVIPCETYHIRLGIADGSDSALDSWVFLESGSFSSIETNITSSFAVTACGSYIVPSGDETYSSSQTVVDTIPSSSGCDSIMTIAVTINNPVSGTDTQTACDSLLWIDGVTYYTDNDSATYTFVNGSTNGCDSIVELNLNVNPTYFGSNSVSICEYDSILIGVVYYSEPGTYYDTLQTQFGCDSITEHTVTLSTIDSMVIRDGRDLIAVTTVDTYQWISCPDSVLINDTNQTFVLTDLGSFNVELSNNGCFDTSSCFNVNCIAYYSWEEDTTGAYSILAYNEHQGGNIVSYLWDFGDGTISTDAYPLHTFSGVGTYNICVTVTDDNGCSADYCEVISITQKAATSFTFKVVGPVSIEEIGNVEEINIYPNPTKEDVLIDLGEEHDEIFIYLYDYTGKLLRVIEQSSKRKIEVSMANVVRGYYTLNIIADDKNASVRVLKE